MNLLTALMLMTLPLSVSAQTLLECYPRDGKSAVQEIVVGNVVINSDEAILFQQAPVFEIVSFDAKQAMTETSRTGSWTTYSFERAKDELITLQIEDAGATRRAYLTRENASDNDEEYFYSFLALKCLVK